MEFVESVKVLDPEGRTCTVFITKEEVNMILSVGINTLLAAGLISVTGKNEPPTEEGTMQ